MQTVGGANKQNTLTISNEETTESHTNHMIRHITASSTEKGVGNGDTV